MMEKIRELSEEVRQWLEEAKEAELFGSPEPCAPEETGHGGLSLGGKPRGGCCGGSKGQACCCPHRRQGAAMPK